MLQPQLKEKSMLETYQNVIGATYTIMDDVLQSARDVKKWVTWRRIVELGFRVQNDGARGRAYVVVENPQQNPNVVTGTFLLNDHYACILFDSGAEKSFVSSAFTHFINIAPATLNTSYEAHRQLLALHTGLAPSKIFGYCQTAKELQEQGFYSTKSLTWEHHAFCQESFPFRVRFCRFGFISLRDDAIVRVSDEPHLEQDSDPEIQAEIDECFAYADALRDRGIDARVVVEAIDRDETETGVRGPVEVRVERVTHPVMPEDIPEPAQEGAVEVTYETLGDLVQRFHDHTQAIPDHRIQAIEGVQREQGHRIVGVESAVIALTERLAELERDNMRLRGTASVESQRVDRLQRGMSRMQRELRQIRRLRFYDRVRVGRLEACARKHMGYRSFSSSA
ncbi:hypothetical protein Tco_0786924 [Tanacetum coccineum]